MTISAISNSLLPVSASSIVLSAQKTGQSSSIPASSIPAQPDADVYTPSQSTAAAASSDTPANHQPGPETTLNGRELAQSQVISANLDVRLALIEAGDYYIRPIDQAWSTLTQSLSSGDITAAQTALAAYTQALPGDPGSLSPLTSPSTRFLNDLSTLSSALQAGDLTTARSEFQTAQYARPDNSLGAFSEAYATGNTSVEATMSLEAVQYTTAQLVWLGYTPENAKIEANIIEIAAVAGLGTGNAQSGSAQTSQLITELGRNVASGPELTVSQSEPASNNSFYNIVSSLLDMKSSSDLNKTLALLDNTYNSGKTGVPSSESNKTNN